MKMFAVIEEIINFFSKYILFAIQRNSYKTIHKSTKRNIIKKEK